MLRVAPCQCDQGAYTLDYLPNDTVEQIETQMMSSASESTLQNIHFALDGTA